jgi:hypothetical protein
MMNMRRFRGMVDWVEDLSTKFLGLLRTPEPVLIPVRFEQTSERGLIERRKLLARSWPRQPPP